MPKNKLSANLRTRYFSDLDVALKTVLAISCFAALLLASQDFLLNLAGALSLLALLWLTPRHSKNILLLSLPIALAGIPAVPQTLTFSITACSIYSLSVVISITLLNRIQLHIIVFSRKHIYHAITATLFLLLAINLFIASTHYGISLLGWMRGFAPFICLALIPLFSLVYKNTPITIAYQPYCLAAAGLIHAVTVIQTYYANNLWRELKWRYIESTSSWQILPTTHPISANVLVTKLRVSLLQPNSTSVLMIVAAIVSVFIMYRSTNRKKASAGAVLLSIVVFAIMASYTRSMIAITLLGFIIVTASFLMKDRRATNWQRVGWTWLIIIGVTIGSIHIQNSNDIIKNRIYSTQIGAKESIAQLLRTGEDAKYKRARDPNLDARINETKKALTIFSKSPLFGAGFGVTYTIPREANLGLVIYAATAYTHNVVSYMLMTTGLTGTIAMLSLYIFTFSRLCLISRLCPAVSSTATLQATILLAMFMYSMSFAIFRLPIYNLSFASIVALGCAPLANLSQISHKTSPICEGIE